MDSHQPLLQTPTPSSSKILYIVLSFLALISTAFVSIYILNPTSLPNTTPLPLHICEQSTLDKESCSSMIMEAARGTTKPENEVYLLESFLMDTKSHIDKTLEMASNFSRRINNPKDQAAIIDCAKLMDISKDRVMDSILALGDGTMISHQNAHAWLSGVLTNHVTCLDGPTGDFSRKMFSLENKLNELISRARISLAMLVAISPSKDDKLMEPLSGDFPTWVTSQDRRLLEALPNQINANVVVAKDGSGNYKTVKEALAAAPKKSKTRYVIYVKKGVYKEKVEVGKDLKNIMLTGDGMDSTIITGSLNVVDGSTTFNSATVAAVGDGFIAQDIGFQNTAGPKKHQAVALRVGADQAVINRCRMDAYQDTLYPHSNRQFYRDSYVTGTVDFIFGNAAVVFQNCKLVARKPMSGQKNMVTAQGRTDPNQNTGTSIQKCEVIASSDLAPVKASFPTYLGRPWKEYSRTVVMQSTIGDHIDPAGWAEWSGDFALKTLYYGEYANKGPGAGTSKRVKWSGYHVITSPAEAQKFTVAQLIQGGSWLKSTGVSYTEGL